MRTLEEQETVIQFDRTGSGAVIDTSDSTMITKLEKLRAKSEHYQLVEIYKVNGVECGRKYMLDDKGLISLKPAKRVLSDEQKKKVAEAMRKGRAQNAV